MVDREVLALAEDANFFGKSPPATLRATGSGQATAGERRPWHGHKRVTPTGPVDWRENSARQVNAVSIADALRRAGGRSGLQLAAGAIVATGNHEHSNFGGTTKGHTMAKMRIVRRTKREGSLLKRGDVFCVLGSATGPGVIPYVEQELEAWDPGVLRKLKTEGEIVDELDLDFFRIEPLTRRGE